MARSVDLRFAPTNKKWLNPVPTDRARARRDYYERNREKVLAKATTWRQANPGKVKQNREKYVQRRRTEPLVWASRRASDLYRKSQRLGLPFNLSAEDIANAIPVDMKCPALGIKLAFSGGRGAPGNLSIDRIRPELGYTRGNIHVISKRANLMKQDSVNSDEVQGLVNYMRRCGL